MSVEMEVKLMLKDISIGKLVEETIKNVALLINCPNVPSLHIVELDLGRTFVVKMEDTLEDNHLFLIYFQGFNEEYVSIALTKINDIPRYTTEKEEGTWVTIGVEGNRGAVQFTLAAGLAYTLGKLNDSMILDEVQYWTKNRESLPSEFFCELVQGTEIMNFSEAVANFHLSLPGKQ